MTEYPPCPKCHSIDTYPGEGWLTCPVCFNEWNPEEAVISDIEESGTKILDSNGVELQNGDTVMVIKDLPVKGSSKALKSGTKVKNIRLTDGDHNIDCKIEGFGSMGLKSEYVKKV